MGLADVILAKQQLKARTEERHQDTALAILSMDMRKAATAQQILLKEYYDKKAEVKQTEKMFDQYDNLKPSDVSQGGRDLISIVDKQNNIDMNAITSNLDMLSSYQSELQSGLGELKGQAQALKEMQMDFAGANRVLEPHEYEAFQEHALKALEEGGLGWETTAGADVEYYKKDPTTRFAQAMQITEKMKSDEDTGAKGNYAILQSMYTLGEKEDLGDLVERLTYEDASGNEIEPSEEVIAAIQRMAIQPSYDDFVTNLNAYPAEAGGDLIRDELISNPNTAMIFNNLQQNVKAMDTLDLELAGINEPDQATNLDQFVSNIAGISNKDALFGLYDQAIEGMDPSQHEPFFNALEAQLGGGDLGAAYMEFKGFAGGGNYSDEGLDSLKYQKDFGNLQLEILGEEGVAELSRSYSPLDIERLETVEDRMELPPLSTSAQPEYNMPAENVNVALERLDRIARLTDLSSQAYQEYLDQTGE